MSSQAFRAYSFPDIISIPTRSDPRSNQHVILLTDIQLSFGSIQRIMSNGSTVLLLTDENFN
jgi:hypothetical protein